MKIDGRAIADKILRKLAQEVTSLKQKGVTPTLAVVLIGDNPASLSYIKQKQKAADTIGAALILERLPTNTTTQQLNLTIQQFNHNNSIHGLIIQRPLTPNLTNSSIIRTIKPSKDVDGFLPNSPFTPPVALAVLKILEEVFRHLQTMNYELRTMNFSAWLRTQGVVVLGRGETAGRPIAAYLRSQQCATSVIHSQTPHPEKKIKRADIIIGCVGKKRVITADMVTPKSILIGVGLWRDQEGKLHGDYEEEEIKDVVAYYTPTPGGVGPVNVVSLMQNLVKACTMNQGGDV